MIIHSSYHAVKFPIATAFDFSFSDLVGYGALKFIREFIVGVNDDIGGMQFFCIGQKDLGYTFRKTGKYCQAGQRQCDTQTKNNGLLG